MITQRKRWMTYTYYNPDPGTSLGRTDLCSPALKKSGLHVCVPFPTMTVNITGEHFLTGWSASTRTKVNKALREELAADRGEYLLKDILRLFANTAAIKGLRGYTTADIKSFPTIECSAILYDGVMLCGHVWLVDKEAKRVTLFVSATNHRNENEDTSLTGSAHYFLLWQDGLYFRQQGIHFLDLHGYDPDTQDPDLIGINTWKAGTHGKVEKLYHYYPVWFYLLRKFRAMFA